MNSEEIENVAYFEYTATSAALKYYGFPGYGNLKEYCESARNNRQI